MTQITPGIWENIPAGADVTAERKGTTLRGVMQELKYAPEDRRKILRVLVPTLGILSLDARDMWNVTYAMPTLEDTLNGAPIGAVYRSDKKRCRIVKVSATHVARVDWNQGGYEFDPELDAIEHFKSFDATDFKRDMI